MKSTLLILAVSLVVIWGFNNKSTNAQSEIGSDKGVNQQMENLQKATFGSGCFWCTEAVFERLKGVHKVVSGYAGGTVENPTYEQVCSEKTGHAEVTQITYDPNVITYDELLEVFWKTHDPTTLNRQGNDVGTQYRSVIFYHNEEQKELAEKYKSELDKSGAWSKPIVTEISPLTNYFEAEDYHQDYYTNNPNQGYCAFVIAPKVEKFEKVFKEKLKRKN
ncbi:MAG: peptide-methionine (S)-S-oxide reductase MsrA [Ignavibacteriaceae bacterium]